MSKATAALKKDLGQITSRLTKLAKSYWEARTFVHKNTCELYALSYQWVTAQASDKPEGVVSVIQRMAKMLHMGEAVAHTWYYCGKMMRENGIDYRKAQHNAVYRLWRHKGQITDAEWRRGLDCVRAGKGVFAVVQILRKSVHLAELQAERRAQKLARLKMLTPKMAKMEAMALCTLSKNIFKQKCSVKVFGEDGQELVVTSCG